MLEALPNSDGPFVYHLETQPETILCWDFMGKDDPFAL